MNSRNNDRIYRSFEEFERDELRRMETLGASVDDMIDAIFGEQSCPAAPARAGTRTTTSEPMRRVASRAAHASSGAGRRRV